MVVCVSDELKQIKDELLKRGYNVVNTQRTVLCDAVICNLKNGGLTNIILENNIKTEGTLIIDSASKSIEEIEYILNNRVYSSLF
ncbi:MAG: YkuS family protein [Bacillota bacterium]|nr:YkuS family protein [Bacillota bacterium]